MHRRDAGRDTVLLPSVAAEVPRGRVCGAEPRLHGLLRGSAHRCGGPAAPAPRQGRAHRLPAEERSQVPYTHRQRNFKVTNPQGADPLPPSSTCSEDRKKSFERGITPLLPTGIGERF
jgi:hypothetical protein